MSTETPILRSTRELKTHTRSYSMRPSVNILLSKLAIIYDRTQAGCLEQLIIADARRYGLIEGRENEQS
jgi:hypothetical protein